MCLGHCLALLFTEIRAVGEDTHIVRSSVINCGDCLFVMLFKDGKLDAVIE